MAAVADNAIANGSSNETEFQIDVRKLVDLLSKLNPSAKEFFPSSKPKKYNGGLSADLPIFVSSTDYYNNVYKDSSSDAWANHQLNRRRRNGYNQGRRRMNERVRRAEREDSIRRTVYVCDIDHYVTEEHLAELFVNCGQVCGDPIQFFDLLS